MSFPNANIVFSSKIILSPLILMLKRIWMFLGKFTAGRLRCFIKINVELVNCVGDFRCFAALVAMY